VHLNSREISKLRVAIVKCKSNIYIWGCAKIRARLVVGKISREGGQKKEKVWNVARKSKKVH